MKRIFAEIKNDSEAMKTRTSRIQTDISPSRSRERERSSSRSRRPSRSKSPSRKSNGHLPANKTNKRVVKKPRSDSPSRQSARLLEKDDKRKPNAEPLLCLEDPVISTPTGMYFGGVLGAVFWPVILPSVLLLCSIYCQNPGTLRKISSWPTKLSNFYNLSVIKSVGIWLAAQIFLSFIPIGNLVGAQIRHERRLIYRCNGLFSLIVNAIGISLLYYTKLFSLSRLYNHWLELTVTLSAVAFILSIIIFIKSIGCPKNDQSVDGSGKWKLYNFLVGHELNPRIFHLDLKLFCLRFGMFTWLALDIACLSHTLDSHRIINPTLIVLTCMHFFYVIDAMFHEETFLMSSTINHDGLGFLLTFGSIAWMPLLFSMPVRFLVEQQIEIPDLYLGTIFLINMIGFIIYRGSNSQKNDFRREPNNPAFSNATILTSKSGRKLITGGWWGLIRHPHYLGDIIMSLSWTLTTGGNYALPWVYFAYLFVHLMHRIYRDERNSARKYGYTWKVYCMKVPYFLIPKLF